MKLISTHEFRAKMATVLDRVWQGETYGITRNGLLVAQLTKAPEAGWTLTDAKGEQ